MRPGGADPSAVLDIITNNVPISPTAEQRRVAGLIVEALEVGGYRIVRAGMVPQLDQLETAVESLTAAAALDLDVGTVNIADGRDTLRSLTELAVAVLGLDPDDRDQTDGAES